MPTGHVEKRSKNAWSIVIDLGRDPATGRRRRIRRSVKGATKRQAEAELRRLLGEVEQGTYVEPTRLTLGDYLRRWLDDSARPRLAPTTTANYETLIERHIIPALGRVPLAALQPLHLQEFYLGRLEGGRVRGSGGVSPRTVVLIHTVLHAALKQAVRWQLLSRNPADCVDVPRSRRPRVRTLSAEELPSFLEVIRGHRDEHLIQMALYTGLRRGELLALRWEDVDLEARSVRVRHGLVRTDGGMTLAGPKTKRSQRQVTVSDVALGILREVRRQQAEQKLRLGSRYHDGGYVFCNSDGSLIDPSSVTHRFADLARATGFPGLRFHDLRHTHATLLLMQGIHPKVVQDRLGHETITTTLDTYSHVLPTLQREAAAAIDAAIGHRLGTDKARRPR